MSMSLPKMSTYLVTGSARGLGLSIVQHLASRPASEVGTIFATSRQDNSDALRDLVQREKGRVRFVQLDAANQSSMTDAVGEVETFLKRQGKEGKKGLDVLVNNAGIQPVTRGGIENLSKDTLNDTFNANVTSAHMVSSGFLPLLRRGDRRVIVNISSIVGSMALTHRYIMSQTPSYKITKAAMNMLTVQYAQDLREEGFTVLAINPGWLRTDLGGKDWADLLPSTGAEATMRIVDGATTEMSGKFFNVWVPGWEQNPGVNQYDGGEIPW